jgi:hypothetical protein
MEPVKSTFMRTNFWTEGLPEMLAGWRHPLPFQRAGTDAFNLKSEIA